jgi:tRNA(Phe) wybutosine-synthesizing methylase Tyw3
MKGVFGWAVALEKVAAGCGFRKSSFNKAAVD